MKIESVSAKLFRHTTNTVRDSDGHGHPGPESLTTSALLTITTDTGHSGQVITRAQDVAEPLLERFVRPNLLGQDPMATDRLWYKVYKW